MTNPTITQSQKRHSESLASLFNLPGRPFTLLFLKSSSDVGVMRNGGRNGAKFAPQSFLSVFKKFSQDEKTGQYQFFEEEVANPEEESNDFLLAQFKQSETIGRICHQYPNTRICHLGGGHDHIYPLLTALAVKYSQVIVINIDAHADTRTDSEGHSGTPFRQFAREYKGKFKLFQVGLNAFSNARSTLTPLEKGEMVVLWRQELKQPTRVDGFFKQIASDLDPDTLIVFSLDADALDGSEVPGVSAVNPDGLKMHELTDLWSRYCRLLGDQLPILGIYELNPVFDAPSMISVRRMAAFVYEGLRN